MEHHDNEKKIIRRCRILGVLFAILLLPVLLLTSLEAVIYWIPGYFEHEYTKYDVLSDVNGRMSMQSVLHVTDEMMSYLKGGRDNLKVYTTIDGKKTEFFDRREKIHMADVKKLFIGGFRLRNSMAIVCLIIGILLCRDLRAGGSSSDIRRRAAGCLGRAIIWSVMIVNILAVAAAALIGSNFDMLFIKFHQVFFDNDMWLLDPARDNLINLLPEGFFQDTVTYTLVIYGILVAAIIAAAAVMIRRSKKQ